MRRSINYYIATNYLTCLFISHRSKLQKKHDPKIQYITNFGEREKNKTHMSCARVLN